ncbi:nudix-type nucleoside diphosphatase, YffH/AdpP family [Roseovarius mucosus DSM 17069]|uniref:ADP-ribose pyrophosphatase n=1 Tax=Roseovarius mucosus DSM 17069 TaxID=1288298 RepID=A0A0A0HH49_9RHOB|nr:NUDIX domain-containing protein [Roseovarius mucosus]KGM86440.1 nudix-type nucleoside diphosphatase, YffH/AdpP family [Roseovarius mucosus DSM 17069]
MGVAPVVVTPLFLYGPLADIHVLQGIFSSFVAAEARAEGMQISCEDAPLPLTGLRRGTGAVDGLLVDHPSAVEDLTFVLSALGLGPAEPLAVHCQGTTYAAQVFPGQPGPLAWDATALRGRNASILKGAIAEILSLKGRVAPEDFTHRLPMILSRAGAQVAAARSAPITLRSPTHADQVIQEASEITHAGFFLSRKYTLRHPRFDGTLSDSLEREVFVATDASLVLPYDPVRDRVLLVEQFRMGPFGRGDPYPWMLEPVAGRIDGGESPEATAHRECLEEAGLTLRGLEKISQHYCTPGYSTEVFHLFLGICDLPDLEQGRGGLATEHEDIRTHVIDFTQAMALVQNGEANNGPLILCLLWLERERARLRASA